MIFRIHENTAKVALQNWQPSNFIDGTMASTIDTTTAPHKMGTSIPNFFARVHLFKQAFNDMKNVHSHTQNTPKAKLLTVCWDMLEFLFQHGNSANLKVCRWDASEQINYLKLSGKPEHQNLANYLQDEIKAKPELQVIYLFYWTNATTSGQSKIHLIGGTSPYTMVFTSPNWTRNMAECGWTFNRLDGSAMFDGGVHAFAARAPKFKDWVLSTYLAYSGGFAARDFTDTLSALLGAGLPPHAMQLNSLSIPERPAQFLTWYTPLQDVKGTQVTIHNGTVPLAYEPVSLTTSDYQIECTSDRYKNYTYEGAAVVLQTPLVLNEGGIPGAKYVGDTPWNPATCQIHEAALTDDLHLRSLPGGMGIQYPFLTAKDFLEDKLIRLPYAIDSKRFLTAFDGNSRYLLPLKSRFFDFFNISDLENIVGHQGGGKALKLLSLEPCGAEGMQVTLRIPVSHQAPGATHHSFIELRKVYAASDIVSQQGQFEVGIFPFYRCTDDPQHNQYAVALYANDIALEFTAYDTTSQQPVDVHSTLRTSNQTILSTTYYEVDQAFDYVAVCINDTKENVKAKGLILPRFYQPDYQVKAAGAGMKAAVDFGTSNTHIAVMSPGHTPEPFSISSMVTFLSASSDYSAAAIDAELLSNVMATQYPREYVPGVIGQGNSKFAFPMRTTTCEVKNFATIPNPRLFGHISPGFNFLSEQYVGVDDWTYDTNLKWAFETDPASIPYKNRIINYFKSLLWMIKSKSLLEGHGLPGTVYITFPEVMLATVKNQLINCWQEAFAALHLPYEDEVDAGGTVIKRYLVVDSESLAPYHAMASTVMGSSFMNIDIGGGTSDILYVVKNGGTIVATYFTSTKFAANDLWGDGFSVAAGGAALRTNCDNGFKSYMDGMVTGSGIDLASQSAYKTFADQIAKNSADIMGYLFKNDKTFNTEAKIAEQKNLFSLIFVHYAAVIYNVARILKKKKLPIPEVLSFTGMGSKYTRLIAPQDAELTELTRILLQLFTVTDDQEFPKTFCVKRPGAAKEMTANGALAVTGLAAGFVASNPQNVNDYGFDTEQTLTYADVSKDEVRKAVLVEYEHFIDLIRGSQEFRNYLHSKFALTICDSLLDDLKNKAEASYNNYSGMAAGHAQVNVTETLFFWPLKHALYEVSKNYQSYQ